MIYLFQCPNCNLLKEVVRPMKDSSKVEVCSCQSSMRRVYTPPGVIVYPSAGDVMDMVLRRETDVPGMSREQARRVALSMKKK